MELSPFNGAFGARVTGLDLREAPDDGTCDALAATLHRHGLLVIPGQTLTPRQYERFGMLWGDLLPPLIERLKVEGADFVNMVGNSGPTLATEEFRNGAAFWHTDRTYVPDPNAVTMLYGVEAPATGGATLFANLAAAWDALDDATRAEINGRHALHRFGAGEREDWEKPVHPMTPEEEARMPPPARHLLARPHDVTGRISLYAPAGSWIAVDGLDDDAARDLMRRLKRHATSERFLYRHRWCTGDVVLWDNTQTLHAAEPIDAPKGDDDRRLLYRIVATGLPPALRAAA